MYTAAAELSLPLHIATAMPTLHPPLPPAANDRYRYYICELDPLQLHTNCYRVEAPDTPPRPSPHPTRLVPVPAWLPRFADRWQIRWTYVCNWRYTVEPQNRESHQKSE
jgi:hypothetical protein